MSRRTEKTPQASRVLATHPHFPFGGGQLNGSLVLETEPVLSCIFQNLYNDFILPLKK